MKKQTIQLNSHNKSAKDRLFFVGDTVYAMNFAGSTKRLREILQDKPASFTVLLEDVHHIKHALPDDDQMINTKIWTPKQTLENLPEMFYGYGFMDVVCICDELCVFRRWWYV